MTQLPDLATGGGLVSTGVLAGRSSSAGGVMLLIPVLACITGTATGSTSGSVAGWRITSGSMGRDASCPAAAVAVAEVGVAG